jgi:hypothetical protein
MPATYTYVAKIPPCDAVPEHGPAYADAKLPGGGPWGYFCRACFDQFGCTLGLGSGQELRLRSEPETPDDAEPDINDLDPLGEGINREI